MSVHNKEPDGTGAWYVHWRDEHQNRHTKTFGKGKIAQAQANKYDKEVSLDKKLGKSTAPVKKAKVYLDDLAEAYVNNCKATGKTGKWLDDLKYLLNEKWLPRLMEKTVEEFTRDDINAFINENYGHVKQITRNRYMDYLKMIFRYGVEQGLTENNPLAKWKKTKEAPREVFLTVPDLMKIRSHASPYLRLAIDLIWHTGIRPGPKELFSLTWNQVDFDSGVIKVEGKGSRKREIPINAVLRKALLEQKEVSKATAERLKREPSAYVIEYHGGAVGHHLRNSLKKACAAAGVEYRVCLYSIRHLYATHAINQGCDIGGLSKNMGHTTLRMVTNQYLHTALPAQRQVADAMPDLTPKEETGKVIPFERGVVKTEESSKKSSNEKEASSLAANPLI